jgi:hypothetical protein
MKEKRVTLNWQEIVFLAGALSHAENHYKKALELKINLNDDDLRMLEAIKKKFGIAVSKEEAA